MQKYLPLFPLRLVAFPTESLNLHIFEPRYKELINECVAREMPFGIPCFLEDKITEFGTEMRVIKIDKRYEDGRMDVSTKGIGLFHLESFDNPAPNKLYSGGLIQSIEDELSFNYESTTKDLTELVENLYQVLRMSIEINVVDKDYFSFSVGHKVGLSIEQEFELLCITNEKERQEYLVEHLKKAIPIIEQIERTKLIVQMNGHFKSFDPLNF
jgi:Lon protease-like protein